MKSKLSRWNQSLQITAILLAGVWAIWTFSVSVWPRLDPNFDGKLTLDSEWFSELKTCVFSIEVEVANKSVLKKEIGRVEFYGIWLPLPRKPAAGSFEMVDFELNREDKASSKLNQYRPVPSPLIGEYAPGQRGEDGFQIFSEPTPHEVLYVEMVLYDKNDVQLGSWYTWVSACREPTPQQDLGEPSK